MARDYRSESVDELGRCVQRLDPDDASRVAYVSAQADKTGPTCARFLVEAAAWYARHGVWIERILTDNAKNYVESTGFALFRRPGIRASRFTGPG